MKEFWQDKVKAFLHDPPDKTLILGSSIGHENKRDEILRKLGLKYDKRLDTADHLASAMQRLNLPEDLRKFHIYFTDPVKPVFKHTLSGAVEDLEEIKNFIATYGYERALKRFGFTLDNVKTFLDEKNWKKTYFLLWRFLPEIYSLGYFLPADTRIPDHSVWDHLDVTAAISSCLGDLGLLAVKIPAVQEFISHSRKLSDLWASSHIFSTIIFEGIKVVIDKFGPDVVIYPQLRGNPMVDLTEFNVENSKFKLLNEGINLNLIEKENDVRERLRIANFPNTFLCFIPASKGDEICKDVEEAIKRKWKEIANKAKNLLKEENIHIDEQLWDSQIESAIEITSAWLEFFNFDKFNNTKNEIPKDLKNKQEKWLSFVEEAERKSNYGHFYSLTYEILGTILTQKSRLWNAWEEKPITGKKCLMCGRRNALIENDPEKGYRIWNGKKWENISVHDQLKRLLKERERLCAVCLVKRLYGWKQKSVFKNIFGTKPPKWESVVHIAAKDFVKEAETDEEVKGIIDSDIELVYKHEWEEKEIAKVLPLEIKKKFEKLWETYREPNKYYAVLMIDGDRIGKTLSGESLPRLGEFLHPAFREEIEKWEKGNDLIEMKRILTPSHHIAISRAMKDFSIYKVPEIVEKHEGFLVYAGGDDVLALFPTDRALEAAKEIQEYFRKDFYEINVDGEKRKVMGLGNKASMSAGIVFAHYKWPLYDAMEKVREAEKRAKNRYGRNAFCITFIKRSGEISTAGGKWDFVTDLTHVAKAVVDRKISHRFIYDFVNVSEVLDGDMLKAEIRRLLKRRKEEANDEEMKEIQGKLLRLIEKYETQGLSIKELAYAIKILFDAYRGEER